MTFSDEDLQRYARHIVLPQVGGVGQRKLQAARVALIGAGGIGAGAIPALAGAGVGAITIIDDDRIELSNLQRQVIFREDQIGQSKAAAAAAFAAGLNSAVAVTPLAERIDAHNASALLRGHDMVIDGSDNFATRLTVSEACTGLHIPLVAAAAVQFQGQVALFRGWEPSQPCYRCFVGDAFDAEDCDNCAQLGVLGALTTTVGSFAALMSICALLGIGDDAAGRLHLLDGTKLSWRPINLIKEKECRTCGGSGETSS